VNIINYSKGFADLIYAHASTLISNNWHRRIHSMRRCRLFCYLERLERQLLIHLRNPTTARISGPGAAANSR
jgi:hypothetical protein